jgi:hypothetical protein
LLPLIFGQTFIDGWYPLILPSTLEPPPSAEPLTPSVAAREKSHTNDSAAATTSTSAPAEVFVSFTLAQSLFTPDEIEDVRVATVAIQSLHALPPNWLDDASRIEEVDEQNRRQRLEEEAAAAAHREKGSRNKGTTTTTGTRAVPSTPKAVLPGPVSSPTNASATANAGNETPQPGESKTRPASRAVGATLPSGGSTAGGNSGGTQVTPRGGGAGGRSTKADKKKDEERKTRDRIPRPLYKLLVAWPANDDTIPTPELPVILPPPEPPAPAVTSSPTPTPPVAASDEKRTTKGGRVGALSPSPLPPPAAVTPTPSVVTTAFPPAPHAVPVPTVTPPVQYGVPLRSTVDHLQWPDATTITLPSTSTIDANATGAITASGAVSPIPGSPIPTATTTTSTGAVVPSLPGLAPPATATTTSTAPPSPPGSARRSRSPTRGDGASTSLAAGTATPAGGGSTARAKALKTKKKEAEDAEKKDKEEKEAARIGSYNARRASRYVPFSNVRRFVLLPDQVSRWINSIKSRPVMQLRVARQLSSYVDNDRGESVPVTNHDLISAHGTFDLTPLLAPGTTSVEANIKMTMDQLCPAMVNPSLLLPPPEDDTKEKLDSKGRPIKKSVSEREKQREKEKKEKLEKEKELRREREAKSKEAKDSKTATATPTTTTTATSGGRPSTRLGGTKSKVVEPVVEGPPSPVPPPPPPPLPVDPFAPVGTYLTFSVSLSSPLILPEVKVKQLPSDVIPLFKAPPPKWPTPREELAAQLKAIILQLANEYNDMIQSGQERNPDETLDQLLLTRLTARSGGLAAAQALRDKLKPAVVRLVREQAQSLQATPPAPSMSTPPQVSLRVDPLWSATAAAATAVASQQQPSSSPSNGSKTPAGDGIGGLDLGAIFALLSDEMHTALNNAISPLVPLSPPVIDPDTVIARCHELKRFADEAEMIGSIADASTRHRERVTHMSQFIHQPAAVARGMPPLDSLPYRICVAECIMDRALFLLRIGETGSAMERMHELISVAPTHYPAVIASAALWLDLNQVEKAEPFIRAIVRMQPTDPLAFALQVSTLLTYPMPSLLLPTSSQLVFIDIGTVLIAN